MAVATYDIGDDVVLRATFKDVDGVLTSPTSVVCRVLDPAGTVTTVAASEASSGLRLRLRSLCRLNEWWFR